MNKCIVVDWANCPNLVALLYENAYWPFCVVFLTKHLPLVKWQEFIFCRVMKIWAVILWKETAAFSLQLNPNFWGDKGHPKRYPPK